MESRLFKMPRRAEGAQRETCHKDSIKPALVGLCRDLRGIGHSLSLLRSAMDRASDRPQVAAMAANGCCPKRNLKSAEGLPAPAASVDPRRHTSAHGL